MSQHTRNDDVELHPRLTARRESVRHCPIPLTAPQVLSTPRSLARHFKSAGKAAGIRGAGSAGLIRPRQAFVRASKILSASAARKALVGQVRYLAREGAGQDGEPTRFFDRSRIDCDPEAFLSGARTEAGHYRIVVSPDEVQEVPDLTAFTRRLTASIDKRVGLETKWIAAAHHDTGRQHVHLLLMDSAPDGRRLGLTAAFLNHEIRAIASEVATELIGPQVERATSRTIKADRFTPLDQVVLDASQGNSLAATDLPIPLRTDALRRITYLETQGYLTATQPGAWAIPSDLRQKLRAVAQRDARQIAATRAVTRSEWVGDPHRLEALHISVGDVVCGSYVGVHRLGPYPAGAQVVVMDTTDGRLGHVLLRDRNAAMGLDGISKGAVISVVGHARTPRSVDMGIAVVGARTGGFWSEAEHRQVFPESRGAYLSFHTRRIDAMCLEGACSKLDKGRYAIPQDFVERALAADGHQWGPADLRLRVLDHRTLADQRSAVGLTWLDQLIGTDRTLLTGPFGDQIHQALEGREQRLRMTAIGGGEPFRLSEAEIGRLRELEVKAALEPLVLTGKEILWLTEGQRAAGTYVGRIHITGQPLAVIEGKTAIHLVRWRAGLENCRGREVAAMIQNDELVFRGARAAAVGLQRG